MTDLSRRTLLGASAAGMAVATFAPASEAAVAAGRHRLYTRGRFVRLRSKTFRFTDETGSWSMKLTRVTDLSHAARGAERSFVLTFRSAVAGPPQGTYTLRRRGFSPTNLFVVPSDARRRTYQVVINGG